MKSTETSKSSAMKKNGAARKSTGDSSLSHEQLNELFIDGLKDIYWAEKALTKALPKMIKKATSEELAEALTAHLAETEGQVTRLEEVFTSIDEKAVAKKCEAMAGLIKEAEEIMGECEDGGMLDAGIISAGQKVEHYEMATYGTLRAFAEILGHEKAAGLLQESLDEEKAADEKLTEVTSSAITLMTAQEEKR